MGFWRIVVITLLLLVSEAFAQNPLDTAKQGSPIHFAKAVGSLFATNYKEDYFGSYFHCHKNDFFTDVRNVAISKRVYLKCGGFFRRFEKYCDDKNIPINKQELKHYRRKSVEWNITMGLMAPNLVMIYFDGANYSARTGYTTMPNVFFRGKYAPLLWTTLIAEYFIGTYLRGSAEKRLKKRIFTLE